MPLHYAAESNSKELGELLISKGADLNARIIIYLKIWLLILINGVFYNKKWKLNLKNFTPLHCAAEKNSKEIGEILISKGADINAKDIIYLNILILFLIKII